jgi:riboflavin kinase / FMN adenylyltransferase
MKVTRGLAQYRPVPHPVLTIGNFDGQHVGHVALLRTVVDIANAREGTPMVLTLDPHPVRVLAPHVDFRVLSTLDEKLVRFEKVGIREVLFLEFNADLAALSPDEFVTRILQQGIGVKDLFVGEHFAFGKNRAGRVADLQRLAPLAGFIVHSMPPVLTLGQVVSSTRIRQFVQAGDVRSASQFLGRPYALGGTVVRGEHRGSELGWPTANLTLPADRVIPADGVYATSTVWKERRLDSVSYVGTRPTFGSGDRLLEVYVLDERMKLYGETIEVQFVEHLRGDLHFDSAEALSAQIEQDVRKAKELLRPSSQSVPKV